jgi:pyruvate/2-oxoglutarate dehydrogenase complex dihydrolipoamide dehydrogenase (E3) component
MTTMHFDETYDVVVVGFGHGGAISAISAAEAVRSLISTFQAGTLQSGVS